MDRRSFLARSGAVAAVAGAALAAPAIAEGRTEWRMVTAWQKSLPGLGVAAQRCADRIAALTDGRVVVKVFAAGEIVPAYGALDAVSNGAAEMYFATESLWIGKHPGFAFFSAVPMGLLRGEIDAWVMGGGGQALWNELAARFGVRAFPCGNLGEQMGGWMRREIASAADLEGLSFRMTGLGGEVLRALGVNVVATPDDEVFGALQSGALDGAEWMGPWLDITFGFYRAAPFYYYPGFAEPGTMLSAGVSLAAFDKLSASDKAAVEAACLAENSLVAADFMAKNGAALATLVSQHGVELRAFPDEVYDGIARASAAIVDALGNQDDLARRIRDAYVKARRDITGWTAIAERAYANQRYRTADAKS